jgi:hypothetical protein
MQPSISNLIVDILPFVTTQLRFRTKVQKQWFGRVVPGDWTLADIYFMMVNGEFDEQAVDKWPWDTRDKGVGNDESIPDSESYGELVAL